MTYKTYGLWGPADLDPRSAKALLAEYFPSPEEVGVIYRPERVTREMRGLRTAIDYFESPAFAGEGACTPSTDLLESLKADRDTEGDEVFLLALWPENPTREDFEFIRSFEAEGIKVYDLARALDELDLSLYTEPEPPKEPKTRARKPKLSDAVSAPVTEELPYEVTPEEQAVYWTEAKVIEEEINLEKALAAMLGAEQAQMIDDYINYKIRKAMIHRTEPVVSYSPGLLETPSSPRLGEQYVTDMNGPPFDGPYVGETEGFFSDRDRNIRPAEGKPRRGEILVNLGPLEVEVAKKEGRYRS